MRREIKVLRGLQSLEVGDEVQFYLDMPMRKAPFTLGKCYKVMRVTKDKKGKTKEFGVFDEEDVRRFYKVGSLMFRKKPGEPLYSKSQLKETIKLLVEHERHFFKTLSSTEEEREKVAREFLEKIII